jgi:hypothetical protein
MVFAIVAVNEILVQSVMIIYHYIKKMVCYNQADPIPSRRCCLLRLMKNPDIGFNHMITEMTQAELTRGAAGA